MESQSDILAATAAVLFYWSLLARSSHLTPRLWAPESSTLRLFVTGRRDHACFSLQLLCTHSGTHTHTPLLRLYNFLK